MRNSQKARWLGCGEPGRQGEVGGVAGQGPGEAERARMGRGFKTLSWARRASPAAGVKSGLSGRVTPGTQRPKLRASLTWPRFLHTSNADYWQSKK